MGRSLLLVLISHPIKEYEYIKYPKSACFVSVKSEVKFKHRVQAYKGA